MSIMHAVANVGDPAPPKVLYVAGTFTADAPVGAATEAKQDTMISHLSDTETLVDDINTNLAAVTGIVVAADGAGTLNVSGRMAAVSAAITRPSDTTAYAAKDAVSDSTSAPTVLTFANLARVNAGSGYIVKGRLMTNQSTNTARFRLHLFHTAPTAINDNSPYTLLWANRANRLGYVDFAACQTEGSGSDAASALNDTVRLPFVCASGSRAVYGLLEAIDAFTPASGQLFFVELTTDNN